MIEVEPMGEMIDKVKRMVKIKDKVEMRN